MGFEYPQSLQVLYEKPQLARRRWIHKYPVQKTVRFGTRINLLERREMNKSISSVADELVFVGLGQYIHSVRHVFNGAQIIFKFDNGLGASVVRHDFSYGSDRGLFEVGAIEFDGDDNWDLTYETPGGGDVVGNLTPAEVQDLLIRIEGLVYEEDEPESIWDLLKTILRITK